LTVRPLNVMMTGAIPIPIRAIVFVPLVWSPFTVRITLYVWADVGAN